ncbi:MAG TPA: DNA topoisomerase IV subunit A [Pengzhenrongella sp.]
MARRTATPTGVPEDFTENIVEIDVSTEMRGSFLEYAYSVIYARALPDARDGLKPVQRRIVYQMAEMGLRPDRGHVKSARVVGDVMGKLHPHGDASIYDALVRLAQPFTLRLPLVDGHGNFGSLDDGPAAPRYTEARQSPAAVLMTTGLDEDVVDFVPNYDNKLTQPEVLPAAFPNLLVNGAAGIAVGMATNMAPHNLVEVIAAARHLVAHPQATLEDLMRFVPGPDLPTGGKIVGLDGVREAYRTGRGQFRTRATSRIENVTAKRKGIIVTELPYLVGPERVIERIKEGVQTKKLTGITNVLDLTDRTHGMRLVIEIKTGFNPEAVLEQLYRFTPLEDSFNLNNVALVDGQPRTLGLRELLTVWVDHRLDVVRRRSRFRLTRRTERLHLVEGLLIAIVDIDEVIQVIRTSDDADSARTRLRDVFDLSEPQAEYILELRLRRLTKFSRMELEKEQTQLAGEIAELTAILADDARLRRIVSEEMADVARAHGTPRRTILLDSAGAGAVAASTTSTSLEIEDSACWALLSGTGLLARTGDEQTPARAGSRHRHDVVRAAVPATTRGEIGAVTSHGRLVRVRVLHLPALPPTDGAPSLSGGVPVSEVVSLQPGETVLALASLDPTAPTLAVGTTSGIVKRVAPGDAPANKDAWDVITLKAGDEVVGAVAVTDADGLVLVSSDASLLRFPASTVRPQGRSAGGMLGIKLAADQRVVFFGATTGTADHDAQGAAYAVVTIAGSQATLPGTQPGSAKTTPLAAYPAKNRGGMGVRAHRFLKGEDALLLAWVGLAPPRAAGSAGQPLDLPPVDSRRDGSGVTLPAPVDAIG